MISGNNFLYQRSDVTALILGGFLQLLQLDHAHKLIDALEDLDDVSHVYTSAVFCDEE